MHRKATVSVIALCGMDDSSKIVAWIQVALERHAESVYLWLVNWECCVIFRQISCAVAHTWKFIVFVQGKILNDEWIAVCLLSDNQSTMIDNHSFPENIETTPWDKIEIITLISHLSQIFHQICRYVYVYLKWKPYYVTKIVRINI